MIFLAALSNDALGDLDSRLTEEINDSGTVRFARLAREAGVRRFVFSSSCSLYGMAGDEMLTEEAGMNPITPYGTAKIEAERKLAALAEAGTFCPVYLRNATAYGLSPALRMDLVVNDLTATAVLRNKVQLLSDGSAWRPLVHVEDIAQAMVAVVEAPEEAVFNEAFNVGRTDENYLIGTLRGSSRAPYLARSSTSPTRPARTHGTTGSISRRSSAWCLDFARSGRFPKASSSFGTPIESTA